jgi:hypothetical protein
MVCIYFRDDIDEIQNHCDPRDRARILLPMSEQYFKVAKQLEMAIKLRISLEKPSKSFGPLAGYGRPPEGQPWPPVKWNEPTDSLSDAPQPNSGKAPGAGGRSETGS